MNKGERWRKLTAAALDCAVVGNHLGILLGVLPYLWWTAWQDGKLPGAGNDPRLGGIWNHDPLRETIVDYLLTAAASAVAISLASISLNRSRRRGIVLAVFSLAAFAFYSAVYIDLID